MDPLPGRGYSHTACRLPKSKSILLNFGLAARYRGRTHLRFDDTKPTTEDMAYVESVAGNIYLEKDREMRLRAEAFDRLIAAALAPSASADMIAHAANELR